MAMLGIDENQTAEIALDKAWRQLAPVVDQAKVLKDEVAQNPERAADPEVEPYVRWLDTFYEELAAVQTINDAAPRLTAEDLRAARITAEKLLWAINAAAHNQSQVADAGEPVPPPVPAAQPEQDG